MKAMILAAGEGLRMRPLTLERPKPLIELAGKPLLQHHLERLRAAGIKDVVINVSYLGEMIIDYFGNGSSFGVNIEYSREESALETAGGILNAAPLLGPDPFVLINGDIWIDYALPDLCLPVINEAEGYLVLVSNPDHNPAGDFGLNSSDGGGQFIVKKTEEDISFTFSGLSVLSVSLIDTYKKSSGDKRAKLPLKPVFDWAIERKLLRGEYYRGYWLDVGTPNRLNELELRLKSV